MELLLVVVGLIIGLVIGFLFAKSKFQSNSSSQLREEQQKYVELDRTFVDFKATSNSQIQSLRETTGEKAKEIAELKQEVNKKSDELSNVYSNLASTKSNLTSTQDSLTEKGTLINSLNEDNNRKTNELNEMNKQFATVTAQVKSLSITVDEKNNEISLLKEEFKKTKEEFKISGEQLATATANVKSLTTTLDEKNVELDSTKSELQKIEIENKVSGEQLATAKANNTALNEKLETQKKEIEDLGKKINLEFENIANRILDSKTEKFTELNKTNLKAILDPLGKNIAEFKEKVDDVYIKESKERFSLGEKVKELAVLNQQISEEARNLTKALKGEAKTQGRWGEMILESILEKSGLVKDREYFMEHELLDSDGNALKSDSEGKKMRPDVVIKYPDNRSVIIDSKVSLNAFTRLIATDDIAEQKNELQAHLVSIKNHIAVLSSKGYDDYDKSLDFVMMFVPSEPAYIAALQGDPDLWNFAYDKRILLLSPTNLITSLKLIVDLWKREYQNQNALEIAERGAKLYDKFVGFVSNLEGVGEYIDKAQGKYVEAYRQLSTGNDNLVSQATKLKSLGLKTKKDLPKEILNMSINSLLLEEKT